jgi:hypothetical protein
MTARRIPAVVAAVCLLVSAAPGVSPGAENQPPEAAALPQGELVSSLFFHIWRNGQHIGNAHLEVFDSDGAYYVNSKTHVLIKLGPATAYDFRQQVREAWRNGRLISYRSDTDDNGESKRIEFRGGAHGPFLWVDGTRTRVSRNIAPTSLWHESMVRRPQFFDPMHGLLGDVEVSPGAQARIRVRGDWLTTNYYTIDGDIQRKLWYAPNGALVQLSLVAPDGSEVVYRLQ